MKVQHHPIDKHLLSIYYVGDSTREQEKVCITRAMLGGREDHDYMGAGEPRCKAERRSVWAAINNQDKLTLQPSSQASLPGSSQWLYGSFPQSILLT